jgi:hypothetical protein
LGNKKRLSFCFSVEELSRGEKTFENQNEKKEEKHHSQVHSNF